MNKRKFLGTIIGVIFWTMCIVFFTYAYYEWKSINTNVVLGIQDLATKCIKGPNVNVDDIGPVFNSSDGVAAEFSFVNDLNTTKNFDINLNITSISDNLLVDSFKYMLVLNDNYTSPVVSGNFSNFEVGENVIKSNVSVSANDSASYKFIVYIDGNMYNNPNMQNNSMKAYLELGNCGIITAGSSTVFVNNAPNLDSGNLIPVYYDNTAEVWKKADNANANNSWYDYDNKMWANAVIVDTAKKSTYQSASVGTTITDADIIAFYVWIPRYKYRVWNITRQGGAESTYAYPAYSTGIQIQFEQGTASTGNVECTYNVQSEEDIANLSDVCTYNKTDTITTTSGNSNYTDAWYTHPAFTFGTEEKTGFWMGKFETGGTADVPKVIPDVSSFENQDVSTYFTISKKFQNYLSSEIDAHMLTNLEWGAAAYLSHSIYGLCNSTTCQGMYINNSIAQYTGRSGGAIAGTTALNLTNVYPDDSTETTQYNTNGYYTYKGYFIDYNGNVTTTKDTSKVASTTGNITGVYDMNGGASEYVMSNMVDSSYNFYPSSSGTSWNGSSTLDTKYYNTYSYGINANNVQAFNRSRLGDATAEVLGSSAATDLVYRGSWQIGSGIIGSQSFFTVNSYSWFARGGRYGKSYSGPFDFASCTGDSFINFSFRSSIS